MASTGPSHVIQVLNLAPLTFDFYHKVEKIPGIQSSEISDLTPYISWAVMALGFIRNILWGEPSSVKQSVRIPMMVDFPTPVGPTNMNPCRTKAVS